MSSRAASLLLLVIVGGACRPAAPPPAAAEPALPPSNRIAVPETVRKNLGIEFVRVERRRVAQTLRVPGAFELLPAGRRELRAPLAGRVEIAVQPLAQVNAGDVVYRLDAPQWRQMQREMRELTAQVQVAQARIAAMEPLLAAHRVHEESLRQAADVLDARVQSLQETRASVGGQGRDLAEAQAQLAQMRSNIAEAVEKEAETHAALAELKAQLALGNDRLELALEAAAAVLSLPVDTLRATPAGGDRPAWRTVDAVTVRATGAGVVDQLPAANGAWVEASDLVLTITDLARVRFRARALQSDLTRLHDGLPAHLLPASGGVDPGARVPAVLLLGVEADSAQRTLDLFALPAAVPRWIRPGVAGFLEVETKSGGDGGEPELAIPLAATVQDGLQRVIFRRDPKDKDQVIRIEADLGVDDGRFVVVESGLRDGDEVVLAGAYELMLASSGSAPKGGHFHADGTFHADDHK
jgi:hypothetical protein